MSSKTSSKKKEKELHSDCWYIKVCQSQCTDSCIRYNEMRYLVDNSGIPKSKQYPIQLSAYEDYDQFETLANIKDDIVQFVRNGENLFIASENTGNGKTSWAIKILLKYFDEVWAGNGLKVRGLFVHVPTLLLQLKNFNAPLSEEYKQNLINADVVVWDEIASTSISTYDYSNLLMFMENRVLNEKSNIFTSNCISKEGLEDVIGVKLASRIWNTSEIIIFKGKDKRNGSITNIK